MVVVPLAKYILPYVDHFISSTFSPLNCPTVAFIDFPLFCVTGAYGQKHSKYMCLFYKYHNMFSNQMVPCRYITVFL